MQERCTRLITLMLVRDVANMPLHKDAWSGCCKTTMWGGGVQMVDGRGMLRHGVGG